MKKLVLILLASLLLISCHCGENVPTSQDELSKIGTFLDGQHPLIPISITKEKYIGNEVTTETVFDDYGEAT